MLSQASNDIKNMPRELARYIIECVGSTGNPPEVGLEYYTVGLDKFLNIIEKEYLKDYIMQGGSAFKVVLGAYGGGKTHFLYSIRELAWKHNYVTSYITLTTQFTPLSRLELVYNAIIRELMYPQPMEKIINREYDKGIDALLKSWYAKLYEQFEGSRDDMIDGVERTLEGGYPSISFRNAIIEAMKALINGRNEDYNIILQWLHGEKVSMRTLRRYGISERIEKTNAFTMIKSLAKFIRDLRYSGLIVFMDEAELVASLAVSGLSSKERNILLSNLRELIDACARNDFKGVMIFYSVPDLRFIEEGRGSIYEALIQRLASNFFVVRDDEYYFNPRGIKINLDEIDRLIEPVEMLKEIGLRLALIYERAYDINFQQSILKKSILQIAEEEYNKGPLETSYRRRFVLRVIEELGRIHQRLK